MFPVSNQARPSAYKRRETLEGTADMIATAGGRAVAMVRQLLVPAGNCLQTRLTPDWSLSTMGDNGKARKINSQKPL